MAQREQWSLGNLIWMKCNTGRFCFICAALRVWVYKYCSRQLTNVESVWPGHPRLVSHGHGSRLVTSIIKESQLEDYNEVQSDDTRGAVAPASRSFQDTFKTIWLSRCSLEDVRASRAYRQTWQFIQRVSEYHYVVSGPDAGYYSRVELRHDEGGQGESSLGCGSRGSEQVRMSEVRI